MNNKRMKRVMLKRRIKLILLCLAIAILLWIVIKNHMKSLAMSTESPVVHYQEFTREQYDGFPYSTRVYGSVVRTTAYCPCEKCCGEWSSKRNGSIVGSAGKELVPTYSVAADKNLFNYGDIITIDGREYRVDDCGGAIEGLSFDIYYETHEQAVAYGKQYKILEVLED